jgi:uncharacterized protein YndB with AHSA1/START domain
MNATVRQGQTFEYFVRATPEAVWRAIVDPAMTEQYFFGTRIRSSLAPGAPLDYSDASGAPAVDGTILEIVPGHTLRHTWRIRYDPALAEEESRVTWTVEARGDVTKLTVVHDCEAAPQTARHVARDGWSVVLSGLKTLLETSAPLLARP